MSVRIVFWMSSFFLLHMLVGCPGAPVTPPLIGTTLPGNELVFKGVDVGQDKVQTFTLFSDSVTPLRVDKIELQQGSDSVFSIVDNGGFPDILESGPKQGRTIKIRFVPTKDRAFSASLLVYAPGADNANPQGIFTIKIRSTPSRLQLLWSCAGSLRFGKIDVGKERTLSCLLTNPGEKTVALKSATYQKSLGRDSSFEWVLPTFPVTLAPQGELQIRIRYRPSEDFLGAEQGVFSLASNLNSQEAKKVLKLKVYGESSASRVLLVEPQSGTCTTQESCSFDKRLQCSTLKDQTSACVPKKGVTPFLLFEPVAAGSSSQRRVVLRAMGSSPLTVKKIQITEGNGSFSLDKQIPLPRLLQPGDTIELNLSYVGKAGKTPKGNLRIQSDSLLMPSQNIALEASPPSCSLRVTPQTLRFSVANEVQSFDIRNVGMADCVLSSFLQSSESPEYFKVLKTPGAALKVGEKVSVQVKYTPPIELEYRGSILIRSNDPVNPEARVSLIGAATKPKDCDLQVSTKSVSFGFVDVGMSTFQKITISNRGIGTCTFQNFEVRESSGALPKAFSIFEPKSTPKGLGGNGKIVVTVEFLPKSPGSYAGSIILSSTSGATSPIRIALTGKAEVLCLRVSTSSLKFPGTPLSCPGMEKNITILHMGYSGCPSTIKLSKSSMNMGSKSPFFSTSGALPVSLNAGDSVTVKVRFLPKVKGAFQDTLAIPTSANRQPQLLIALSGDGENTKQFTDVFVQPKARKLDVLLVMDDSCSMADDQLQLSKDLDGFFSMAKQTQADYRVLVTTTHFGRGPYPEGCARGSTKIVTSQTPNPSATLANNLLVGTNGSGLEAGLNGAMRALLYPVRDDPKCNKGFYRPDADLAILILSDEEDGSPRKTSFYSQFFKSLKANTNARVTGSVIGGGPPTGCKGQGRQAMAMLRYWNFARDLTGVTLSFCQTNWKSDIANWSRLIFSPSTRFRLARKPVERSLVIKVNGKVIPKQPHNGWAWDQQTQEIVFSGLEIPPPGAIVSATYQTSCSP